MTAPELTTSSAPNTPIRSPRTFDPRLRDLLDEMDARSRIQAGWVAADRVTAATHFRSDVTKG